MPRIHDVALVFEGGGMRASYTAGLAVLLMEQGVEFDFVCGISAGSSHTANFVSRDIHRTRVSFTDFVLDPHFGGFKTFMQGKGAFSAQWIYQEAGKPDGPFPFDYETCMANPARLAIQAFDRDSGATVVWGKQDMPSADALMVRVRASSTLPVVMPAVHIGGHVYYDGGLGQGAGIPIHMAEDAGYKRMLVLLTRPRGYRKPAPKGSDRLIADLYRAHPHVREALLTRPERYNAELERLEGLERAGDAYLFCSTKMAVSSGTTDHDALVKSYEDGYAQAQAEWPRIKEFLGIA